MVHSKIHSASLQEMTKNSSKLYKTNSSITAKKNYSLFITSSANTEKNANAFNESHDNDHPRFAIMFRSDKNS